MTHITQQQLESYLWGAAVLLRGTIDAGDYKQFIFPLLFFKRLCDVYDEETLTALHDSGGDLDFALFPENHRFQIPADAHWREIRKVNREVGRSLQQAMRTIEAANQDKLMGIFGDAQWTNKDRLSDAMLRDLIEHFSTLELTVANLPEDELGQGYEYLIKKFADDSGHTAAEFYTNRTVVHLMTEMLDVQPGESVYDPTCGSGGMLLSCISHLRRQGKEWRNVKLYGQERNLMTSSIARMNCFLHGIEDFRIERGDTLAEPKLVAGDRLQRFDVVLANPPYSIKQWNREAFAADPWGRNVFGVPPQGRADYAFQQHIVQSLRPHSGRCAVLWPHGVLFRQEEAEMRRKLIETDLIECVIGLGPNLFYNSPMEACIVLCRSQKPKTRRGKILFINAVNEVTRERAQSFLTDAHIQRILLAYRDFKDEAGFARVVPMDDIRAKDWSLNISLFVINAEHKRTEIRSSAGNSLGESFMTWLESSKATRDSLIAITQDDAINGLLASAKNLTIQLPPWLDRSKWQRFQFGDIAECARDMGQPQPEDAPTYIGLEHMDTGSLHIRRWGSDADLKGQKLKMLKGDILFAKRNAYLRRVAIAPHDGFFSAHGMILRAKTDKVLPEFLPFLMMSDRFMNRAVEISVGSLSPTINWTTLKLEAFDLPPLDQQRRIAEILWAVDEAKEHWIKALNAIQFAISAYAADAFHGITVLERKNGIPSRKLSDIFTIRTGGTPSRANDAYWGGDILWVKTGEINYQDIFDSEEKITALGFKESAVRTIPKESILMALYGQGPTLGRVAQLRIEATINQACAAIFPSPDFEMRYVYHYLANQYANIRSLARGASQPNINALIVKDFFIPTPPLSEQLAVVAHFEQFNVSQHRISQHLTEIINLRSYFTNTIL